MIPSYNFIRKSLQTVNDYGKVYGRSKGAATSSHVPLYAVHRYMRYRYKHSALYCVLQGEQHFRSTTRLPVAAQGQSQGSTTPA